MRAGRVEEAGAVAVHIGKEIARRNETRFSRIDSRNNAKNVWVVYRLLTGQKQKVNVADGIRASRVAQSALGCHFY